MPRAEALPGAPRLAQHERGIENRPPYLMPWWKLLLQQKKSSMFKCVVEVANMVSLIVLLVLASIVDSPRHPRIKQNRPTEHCPGARPHLFVTWMACSVVQLFFQQVVRAWRTYRHVSGMLKQQVAYIAALEEAEREELTVARWPNPPTTAVEVPPPALPSDRWRGRTHNSTPAVNVYRHSTQAHRMSAPALPAFEGSSPLDDAARASPPLSYPTPPGNVSSPALRDALPRAGQSASLPQVERDTNSPTAWPADSAGAINDTDSINDLPMTTGLDTATPMKAPESRIPAMSPPVVLSVVSVAHSRPPSRPPSRQTPALCSRSHLTPNTSREDRELARRETNCLRTDRIGRHVNEACNISHFVLFVVAHPLLFNPVVWDEHSCAKGAPLLWGGTLATVAMGWIFTAKYFLFVVAAILAVLYHLLRIVVYYVMGWELDAAGGMVWNPVSMREKLSITDLDRCALVCYLPHPDEPLPEPSLYGDSDHTHDEEKGPPLQPTKSTAQGTPVPAGEADPLRLCLPSVTLRADQATCAICQESFHPPREIEGQTMYEVQWLRQLPCNHIFHQACVDEWLTNHSCACPYCNQDVVEMLAAKENKSEQESPQPAEEV